MAETTRRFAVVTGANKGIGLETVRQLASAGIKVFLTARDEKRGLEALERLKSSGLSELVIFHQLDVADPATFASLAHFIESNFDRLDILVNNAGIGGVPDNVDAAKAWGVKLQTHRDRTLAQTYELAEECLQINCYGAKRTAESLIPLLQLSDSPRIVNVSSSWGTLENISNEWAKGILSDAEKLTEERIDEILKEFLKDFRESAFCPPTSFLKPA